MWNINKKELDAINKTIILTCDVRELFGILLKCAIK